MKISSRIQDDELTEEGDRCRLREDRDVGRMQSKYIWAMNTESSMLVKYCPFYLPRRRPDHLWLTFDSDLQVIRGPKKICKISAA